MRRYVKEGAKFYMKILRMTVALISVCTLFCIRGMAATEYTVTPQDDIQSIIDNCNDSESNKVTIYMQEGKYEGISARSDMTSGERFISFIGIGEVVVESDSGYYDSPAAEFRLNGTVDNIQFISAHPQNVIELNDKGAYAVHADYGSMHTVFNNCKFTSYQTAAVGMGLTYDSEVIFNNCRFENKASRSFGAFNELGALYVHSGYFDNNTVGAKLTLNNCSFFYPDFGHGSMVVEELNGSKIELNVSQS